MGFNIQAELIWVAALGRRRKKAVRGISIIDNEISSPCTTCARIVVAQIQPQRGALPCAASFDTPFSPGSFGPLRFGVGGLFFYAGEHSGRRPGKLRSAPPCARTKRLQPDGTLTLRLGHSCIGTVAVRCGARISL
jgi:hypothetical protein